MVELQGLRHPAFSRADFLKQIAGQKQVLLLTFKLKHHLHLELLLLIQYTVVGVGEGLFYQDELSFLDVPRGKESATPAILGQFGLDRAQILNNVEVPL